MNIIKNVTASAFLLTFLVVPSYVGASLDDDYDSGLTASEYNNKGGNRTVTSLVVEVISFFLTFMAALAVVVIVISGIMYITSGGDEGKVETAKNWIMYAIIGLIIALLGWVIINIVSDLVIG